jgi:fatty-acyl-CoA synthase
MSGYLDDPDATADVFRGGWLHTGDVLVRHEDGTLTFTDRQKYLIKTGGENVYPAEVEQVIAAHEAVQEVCVFGVADEQWGETVKAVVVLLPDRQLSRQEIVDWCRMRLAGYKRPRYVEFLRTDDIPRSTTGKVLRGELARRTVSESERI